MIITFVSPSLTHTSPPLDTGKKVSLQIREREIYAYTHERLSTEGQRKNRRIFAESTQHKILKTTIYLTFLSAAKELIGKSNFGSNRFPDDERSRFPEFSGAPPGPRCSGVFPGHRGTFFSTTSLLPVPDSGVRQHGIPAATVFFCAGVC